MICNSLLYTKSISPLCVSKLQMLLSTECVGANPCPLNLSRTSISPTFCSEKGVALNVPTFAYVFCTYMFLPILQLESICQG